MNNEERMVPVRAGNLGGMIGGLMMALFMLSLGVLDEAWPHLLGGWLFGMVVVNAILLTGVRK